MRTRSPMRSMLFVLLLPVFFVFHGYVESSRFIDFSDCLVLMGIYSLVTLAVFFLFSLLLKQQMKAALMTTFIMSFYFFFGALHDFFRKNDIFLYRYSLILPLFLIMACLLFLNLKKRTPSGRISLFLNYLFLIYLLTDAATLLWHHHNNEGARFTSDIRLNLYKVCDSCPKPDIYFLLFDEYSGNKTLKDVYHYDNSDLDAFLGQQGFRVQTNSRSNYNFTPFSMTSILSTSYLTNIKDPLHIKADDYEEAIAADRKLPVISFLMDQGYAVINNSSFDLPGTPSYADQPFIALKTRLITDRTLTSCLIRDMGWWLTAHFHHSLGFAKKQNADLGRMNQRLIDKTIEESKKPSGSPRFVYMHVFMPHIPFLYDSLQRPRDIEEVMKDYNYPNVRNYLNYIPYTNACLKKLVSAIKKNTGGKALIIFMSDHGYRQEGEITDKNAIFNNQNAIFFPDGNYGQLYDSISAVNEFRYIFNQVFRQNVPLLKDSLVYLKDDNGNGNSGL